MRHFLKSLAVYSWYLLATALIVLAILSTLLKSLTPFLNDHKAEVEQYLSNSLNREVTIQSVEANWGRLGPIFTFHGATISQDGKTLLSVGELSAHIGIFKSIANKTVYFRSFTLSDLAIDIDQVSQNKYVVNDSQEVVFDKENNITSQHDLMSWLLLQRQLSLKNVSLKYENQEHKVWQAKIVDFNLIKYTDFYQLSSLVELSGNIHHKVSVAAKVSGDFTKPHSLSVHAYFDISHLELGHWLSHFDLGDTKVTDGFLDSQVWVDWRGGKTRMVQTQFQARGVELANEQNKFNLSLLSGHVAWLPQKNGDWKIIGDKVRVFFPDHRWPATEFEWDYHHKTKQQELLVNYINLGDLEHLAVLFPKHGLDSILTYQPQGELNNLYVSIPKETKKYNTYYAVGKIKNASVSEAGKVPGIKNLTASFFGSLDNGHVLLDSDNVEIDSTSRFTHPVMLQTLESTINWHEVEEGLQIHASDINAEIPGGNLYGNLAVVVPKDKKQSPRLSLLAGFQVDSAAHAVPYLPSKYFGSSLNEWLDEAFVSGGSGYGTVVYHGSLADFPNLDHKASFIIDTHINDLQLHYAQDWPDLTKLSGRMVFDGPSMQIDVTSGQTDGIVLDQASVAIPNFETKSPVLEIIGKSHEDSDDALNYIHASPLNKTLGLWLKPFDLKGALTLGLKITMPLHDIEQSTKVSGTVYFKDNTLAINPINMDFTKLAGQLAFTKESINSKNLSAIFGEHAIRASINTTNNASSQAVDVLFDGTASVNDLKQLTNNQDLSHYLSGQAAYSGHVAVPMKKGDINFSVKSNLKGMAVNLALPFTKAADQVTPLALSADLGSDNKPIQINLTYDQSETASAQYYSASTAHPDGLLNVSAKLSNLVWPLVESGNDKTVQSTGNMIGDVKVQSPTAKLYGYRFNAFALDSQKVSGSRNTTIKSQELSGNISVPDDKSKAINAKLAFAILSSPEKSASKPGKIDMANLRAFNLSVNRLIYNKKFFGKVTLATTPVPGGMDINQVTASSSIYDINAKGSWLESNGSQKTHLTGVLNTSNTGNFLNAFQINHSIKAGKGQQKFSLNWPGSPFDFNIQKVSGVVESQISDGVIPISEDSVTMGLSKILSLFSVESIKRRLQFNFSDLSSDGYSFNIMQANVTLTAGDAKFTKSDFDGPQAKVEFDGRVGLAKKDYDVNLVVTPYVTSTLPIIATIAGGPIAGVATYAIDKIAGSTIAKATSYKYLLKGSWEDPQLINLNDPSAPVSQATATPVKKVIEPNNSIPGQ